MGPQVQIITKLVLYWSNIDRLEFRLDLFIKKEPILEVNIPPEYFDAE